MHLPSGVQALPVPFISTIGIPFPVSTRIHKFEDYVNRLNKEKKTKITDGLASGFS